MMVVSIHALLAECDLISGQVCPISHGFNPRTPCGVRHQNAILHYMHYAFQSTHSLRSATDSYCKYTGACHVSIHALLAECDERETGGRMVAGVSIHALLAECDLLRGGGPVCLRCFNPRTPCGVRRISFNIFGAYNVVSIHALLAECDV